MPEIVVSRIKRKLKVIIVLNLHTAGTSQHDVGVDVTFASFKKSQEQLDTAHPELTSDRCQG